MDEAKKKKNAAVLQVLEREAAKPKPVDEAQMEAVRSLSWFPVWRANLFKSIDRAFDADATQIDLLVVMGEDNVDAPMAAIMVDLEAAFKSGTMGGGSFRQVSQERLGPEMLVKKLSKLDDEQYVLVAACPAAKRDAVAKKASKYDKTGTKIVVAWAMMEAYPVA